MCIMEETSRKSEKLFIKDLQILKTPLGAPKVYLFLKSCVDYCRRLLTFLTMRFAVHAAWLVG